MALFKNTTTQFNLVNEDLSNVKKYLEINHPNRNSNQLYVRIDEKTAGTYNTNDLTNISSVTYTINGVADTLPFTLNVGDVLYIDIGRTVDEVYCVNRLYNNTETYTNTALDFVWQGGVNSNPNANYDPEMFLFKVDSVTEGTYNTLVEAINITSYTFKIDSGSGFESAELPFTVSDGDSILIEIDKEIKETPANLLISQTTLNTIVTARKSPFGIIPYCTPKFNGVDQFATMSNAAELRMSDNDYEAVSVWVYPYNNATECVFSFVTATNDEGWYLKLKSGTSSPTVQFQLFDDSGNSIDVNTVSEIPLNQWTFILVAKSSSGASGVKIYTGYKNTKTLTDQTLTINSDDSLGTTTNTGDCFIGKDKDGTKFYSGRLDNFNKYNRELTTKEIEVFFNNGWAGFPESVVEADDDFIFKVWRLPFTSFNYFKEFSSSGNNAIASNFLGVNNYMYYRETLTPFIL